MTHNKKSAAIVDGIQERRESAILRLWESYDLVSDITAQCLILFAIERLLEP